jgi:hypothetical protein
MDYDVIGEALEIVEEVEGHAHDLEEYDILEAASLIVAINEAYQGDLHEAL